MVELHKQIKIPDPDDIKRAKRIRFFRSPYLIFGGISYLLVILMVIVYLHKEPVFSSNMALVLPGSGSSTSFQINDVGQANTQTKSPFAGASFNPRVNYKEMLKSREVIDQASRSVFMAAEAFGLPKVKLTEQTSIIQVDVSANDGQLAKEKAWALYNALQTHLDVLRADEALRRDESIQKALDQYRVRLNQTRSALIDFQQRALLVDQQQVSHLMTVLSDLKAKVLFANAELKQKTDFVQQLSFDLGVSPALAGKAFALQTDTQFRGHLVELEVSSQEFSEFRSMWGSNHPKVKAIHKRVEYARTAAFTRSSSLLGDVIAQQLQSVNLEASPDRARLFSDLLDSYAQLQGKSAEIRDLEASSARMDDKLRIYARESKELERLQREYDLAQAVFTSAAARLEGSKSDVFASYPVLQLLTAPNAPIQQKSPNIKIAILGLVAGFLFITIALVIVWQRAYLVKRLLGSPSA
jgi:uncharacterized protein involved in exopolysaccharide biosynthesis